MKTLQEHYNAIKTGQGNKAQFVKQARNLFPEYFNQYTNYDNAVSVLKSKQIISEAAGGVVGKGFDIYDWKKILNEETKAAEKETSKEVLDDQKNAYNNSDMKNADNVNFNEIMKGFYAEMKDPENAKKTGDELKAMVVKNLAKDPLYYTKSGEFGTKGVGYTDEAPGLGKNTQPTTKESTVLGGNDKVDSDSDIVKNSLVGSTKKNVQDTLGKSEAKTSNPKKVKEMPDKGVSGVEKKMKLQEGIEDKTYAVYELRFGQPYNFYNEEQDRFIPGEKNEATLYTKEEAEVVRRKLLKPRVDYYQKTGNNYQEIHVGDLFKKGILKATTDEALYQGPSVKVDAGGSLGGKRFIPRFTALSRDAVDAINAKGAKRLNWGKPHIKIVKSGEGVKLLISKLLVDTIVGSERGRSKLSLAVSKMGTGITPEEMSEVTGEFKKLIKVLSANGKLTQNGDYFLLDVPTKYNEKYNQFEMPLPAEVAESEMTEGEQKLRSLIRNIINEELESTDLEDGDKYSIKGKEGIFKYGGKEGEKHIFYSEKEFRNPKFRLELSDDDVEEKVSTSLKHTTK